MSSIYEIKKYTYLNLLELDKLKIVYFNKITSIYNY